MLRVSTNYLTRDFFFFRKIKGTVKHYLDFKSAGGKIFSAQLQENHPLHSHVALGKYEVEALADYLETRGS